MLKQSGKELMKVCPYCLLVQRYPLFFKCGHIKWLPCLEECRRHICKFEIIIPCQMCKQSSRLNEIYTYKVEKRKRPYSISMRMFKQAKFICSYEKCGTSYSLEIIHHHEMFECLYRSFLCPAEGFKFINNVETVILHSINCHFLLLYCALCKSLYNLSVLTHDCNVIKFLRSIFCSNIIKRICQLITSIKMFSYVIIHTLRILKIEEKLTMICLWA